MEAARSSVDEHGAGALLSDRDRGILEFERQWWKYAGAKEQAKAEAARRCGLDRANFRRLMRRHGL